jgi:hypothetical protein
VSGSPPRVGVLIGPSRLEEGLRMASALPLADSEVEIILTGPRLGGSDEIATHIETIQDFEIPVLARFQDERVTTATTEEIARRLTEYDHVLSF